MMRRRTAVVWMAIGCAALLGLPAILWQFRERWYMISIYRAKSQPVEFYGRVVDQQGNPIPGAGVTMRIEDFNPKTLSGSRDYMVPRRVTAITDGKGEFSVTGTTGIGLFVESVSNPKYVSIPEEGWRNRLHVDAFSYSKDRGVRYYVPDKNRPAIFPLRHAGEERVLWPSRGGTDECNPW